MTQQIAAVFNISPAVWFRRQQTVKMPSFDSGHHHSFRLIIVGDSKVGKSSLLARYSHNEFPQGDHLTLGVDFKIRTVRVNGKRVKLEIWDTAGQERYRSIVSSYYRGVNGVILMYDVTSLQSFKNVQLWLEQVDSNCDNVCRLLVGNKNDNPLQKIVPTRDAQMFADQNGLDFVEISAKERIDAENVFTMITRLLLEQEARNQGNALDIVEEESINLTDPRIENIRMPRMCC